MADKPGWMDRFRRGRDTTKTEALAKPDSPHPGEAVRSLAEGRRGSTRLAAPLSLYHLIPPDRFVPLELRLQRNLSGKEQALPCFLFDINETGLGFACEESLPVGEKAFIEGHLAGESEPLVRCDLEIVDQRPYPPARPHPAEFNTEQLHVYGGTLQMRDAMILLKTTMDCLSMLMSQTAPASDAQAEAEVAPESAPPPRKPRAPAPDDATELSFGSLPVAGVEIIDAELRRQSERSAIGIPLGYVDEDGDCHRIRLQIGRPDKGVETSHLTQLIDFSADGARVESDRKFEVGEVLVIFGHSLNSDNLLFEDRFTVRNRHVETRQTDKSTDKEFTFGTTVAESLEKMEVSIYSYGLHLHESGSNLLYKAIMDSVLLNNLNADRDTPIENIADA